MNYKVSDPQQDLLQYVEDATKAVEEDPKRNIPGWKTAILAIRIMHGESNVLSEIPTLDPSLQNALKPGLLGDVSSLKDATSAESIQASTGLFGMTKDNVKDIWRYVNTARALPTNVGAAETALGYKETDQFSKDHPGFAPSAFVKFYQPFFDHAGLWNDLQNGTKGILPQSTVLTTFATSFVTYGNTLLDCTNDGKLSWETIDGVEVPTEDDKKVFERLSDAMLRLKTDVDQYQKDTNSLLVSLAGFQETMNNTLKPSADVMYSLLNRLDLTSEISKLKAKIDNLKASIDTDEKEYKQDVGLAFTGVSGLLLGALGIISWAVTGGIFGNKAEKARKRINENTEKLDGLQKTYDSDVAVAKHVAEITGALKNLDAAIVNAVTGLTLLNTVWSGVSNYIDAASKDLKNINDKTEVFDFRFDMKNAVAQWTEVPDITSALLELFTEAQQEVS